MVISTNGRNCGSDDGHCATSSADDNGGKLCNALVVAVALRQALGARVCITSLSQVTARAHAEPKYNVRAAGARAAAMYKNIRIKADGSELAWRTIKEGLELAKGNDGFWP
jgi:hypothetical protein